MSGASFLAWSLAASGLIALAIIGIPRTYQIAAGKPFYHPPPRQGIVLFCTVLILGPMSVRFVCELLLDAQPPRWSSLLMGPMFFLFGVQDLLAPRAGEPTYQSRWTAGYIMCAMGLLISVLELSTYLATART